MSRATAKASAGGARAAVSSRAQAALDYFVAKSFKATFAQSPAACTVEPCDEAGAAEHELVMLTVSSYLFRLVLFVHFERDDYTRAHLAALVGQPDERLDDERFNDVIMERGNLCCGALNRDLAEHYPHTGMSTPCLLDRKSIEHVSALDPAYTRSYRAAVAEGVPMHITLALCTWQDMDFPFEPQAEEEADTSGELEMF